MLIFIPVAISIIISWSTNSWIKKHIPDKDIRKKWRKEEDINQLQGWCIAPVFLVSFFISTILNGKPFLEEPESCLDFGINIMTVIKWLLVVVSFGFGCYGLTQSLKSLKK